MALRKQPLIHVFPAPRKPEPPPNRYIRDGPPFPALLLALALGLPIAVGLVTFLAEEITAFFFR